MKAANLFQNPAYSIGVGWGTRRWANGPECTEARLEPHDRQNLAQSRFLFPQ